MVEQKKICLVSNTAWYLYNFRKDIIQYFSNKGFKVYAIAPTDDYTPLLLALGIDFIEVELSSKGMNPFQDIKFYKDLKKIYTEIRPDFIFHYTIKPNIYGALAAKSLNIPSISVVSGAGIVFLKKNILFKIVRQMYKQSGLAAQAFWFVNEDDKRFFLDENIISEKKTLVLPGEGIDTSFFQRKASYTLTPNTPFVFLFSARLLWVKGIKFYIEAARRLKNEGINVRCVLIGFFDYESPVAVTQAEVQNWVDEGIIEFAGSLKDVRGILETINCFVFPSYYREGVPRVLLEAASMEIPIITTENVGCRDVVKDGYNGILCRVHNSEDVYSAMNKILNMNEKALIEMGQNGRRLIIEKFDIKFVIKHYEEVID